MHETSTSVEALCLGDKREPLTVFIYILSDPRPERRFEVRYVGKALNLKDRLNGHMKERRNTRKCTWIKALKALGLKPRIEVIEVFQNSDDEDWQPAERFWISYFRFLGCDLTNSETGGRGGKCISEDVKQRLSVINKGKKRAPFTAEHRANLSAAGKGNPLLAIRNKKTWTGRKHSPEAIEKFRKIARSRPPISEETRRKIAEASRGRKRTPEQRAKMSAAKKGRVYSPEHCAKISAGKLGKATKRKLSPEEKAKLLQARWPHLVPEALSPSSKTPATSPSCQALLPF